jgi:hypothetical protein
LNDHDRAPLRASIAACRRELNLRSAVIQSSVCPDTIIQLPAAKPERHPDSNYTGYDFWLTKLNNFNSNITADMVKAFWFQLNTGSDLAREQPDSATNR